MAGKIAYIRLDPQAENGIALKIAETGVNQSEAIRLIIREWVEMKKYFVKIPVKGFVDDAGNVQYFDAPADRED
jgi:hypothetical protein